MRVLRTPLLLAVIAAAMSTTTSAPARDQAGEFDFYVLALSIAPSFCDLTGYRAHKAQCQNPSDADFRATPLTIHGLWPNRRAASVRDQPQSCSTAPLPRLADDLFADLKRYMPGIADRLQQHEWSRHGVCSGLDADSYFRRIVALAKAANDTIGTVMKDKDLFGKPMAVTTLIDAVAAQSPDLAEALQVDCQFARRGPEGGPSRAYVGEIRVLIAKDLTPNDASTPTNGWPGRLVPRSSVGYGANSGCPGGVGFLPGSFSD
jgi:ribonuclease T2